MSELERDEIVRMALLIRGLENKLLASNMHNEQLSTTGSIAMDKVEELLARVEDLSSQNVRLRARLDNQVAYIEKLEPVTTSSFCTKHNQMFLPEHKNLNWQTCPFCTIEELEADVLFYRGGDVQDSTDPVMLRKQIEELKDDAIHNEGVMVALREGYTAAEDLIERSQDKGYYVITEEMVNAAWPYLHGKQTDYMRGAEDALKEFHIFRCEGCDGSGNIEFGTEDNWRAVKHSDCNGKGYTIGE
jgi:hypothetical protein